MSAKKPTTAQNTTAASTALPLIALGVAVIAPARSLHQLRALEVAHAGFGQDAEAACHLLVALLDVAEVAAEAVLVHLLAGLGVPQAAVVGGDLVGEDDPHLLVLPQAAELQLEVHELDADAEEEAAQEVVYAERERHHVVEVLGGGPAEGGDVLLADERVVELVVLVVVLNDGARQPRAFLDAEASGQAARRDVADHQLQRDDLHLAEI